MLLYYIQIGWLRIKKTPMLSGLVVLALGLGIGVFTSLLTLFSAISYNPAGDKSEQLFAVQLAAYGNGMDSWGEHDGLPTQLTHQDVMNLKKSDIPTRQSAFYQVSKVLEVEDGHQAPTLEFRGGMVDGDFFSMFGLQFIYGSVWPKNLDQQGQAVVIIDENLNNWAFNGENSTGKTLLIQGMQFTVSGVIKAFQPRPYYPMATSAFSKQQPSYFIPHNYTSDVQWWPIGNMSGWRVENMKDFSSFLSSEMVWDYYWVELNHANQKEQYKSYLSAYSLEQKSLGRFNNPNPRGSIRSVSEWLVYNGVVKDENRTMVALSGLFLLVCLFNCMGLVLSKSYKQTSDTAVRRALGATQSDVVFQQITEAIILGVGASITGLIFTQIGLTAIREWFKQYQDIATLPLDIALFAIGISVITSIIAALYPAFRVASRPISSFLRS